MTAPLPPVALPDEARDEWTNEAREAVAKAIFESHSTDAVLAAVAPFVAVERERLQAEVDRLRAGEAADVGDLAAWPTPAQFLRRFNDATAEQRLMRCEWILEDSIRAQHCTQAMHERLHEDLATAVADRERAVTQARADALDEATQAINGLVWINSAATGGYEMVSRRAARSALADLRSSLPAVTPTDGPVAKVRITINRLPYEVDAGVVTGAQVLAIPFPPIRDDKWDLWRVGRNGEPDTSVGLSEHVEMVNGGGFYTAPRFINAGSAVTPTKDGDDV